MSKIEECGCSQCFAAVYQATDEEKRLDICEACLRRARERAVQDWRDFEDLHADVLDQT